MSVTKKIIKTNKFAVKKKSDIGILFENIDTLNFSDLKKSQPFELYLLKNLKIIHNRRVHGAKLDRGQNNHFINRLINSTMSKRWNLGKKSRAGKIVANAILAAVKQSEFVNVSELLFEVIKNGYCNVGIRYIARGSIRISKKVYYKFDLAISKLLKEIKKIIIGNYRGGSAISRLKKQLLACAKGLPTSKLIQIKKQNIKQALAANQ